MSSTSPLFAVASFFLFLFLLPLSSSRHRPSPRHRSSLDVCQDPFSVECGESTGVCAIFVRFTDDSVPACGAQVNESAWPMKPPPQVNISGKGCCSAGDGKLGLILVDADEPSCGHPKVHYKLYWLVLDFQCDEGLAINTTGAEVIEDYSPPKINSTGQPTDKPQYHRYQFFFFKYSSFENPLTSATVDNLMRNRTTFFLSFANYLSGMVIKGRTEFHTKNEEGGSGSGGTGGGGTGGGGGFMAEMPVKKREEDEDKYWWRKEWRKG